MTRLMSWPGGTQTATSGANCSVTVTAPALRSLGPGGPLRPGQGRQGQQDRQDPQGPTMLPDRLTSVTRLESVPTLRVHRLKRREHGLSGPPSCSARPTDGGVGSFRGNSAPGQQNAWKLGVMRQLRAGVSAEFGRPSADFTTKSVGPRSSIQRGDSYSLAVSSASARTISIPTASRSRAASAALETTLRGVWFILLREKGQSYGVEEADDRKSDEGIPPVIRDSDE